MSQPPLEVLLVKSGNRGATKLMAALHKRAFMSQGGRPWTRDAFEDLIASPGFEGFVYSQDQAPVGFALVRCVLDEAELVSIAVEPDRQGQGLAKAMFAHLLSHLKSQNINRFFLEVREDNRKAIQLYRATGFEKIGERSAYYQMTDGKSCDAYVFSLRID